MTTVVVVVIDESLDSKEQVRAIFLRLDVNVLVFYRFPKSFYPNVVFGAAASVAGFEFLQACLLLEVSIALVFSYWVVDIAPLT